MRGRAGRSLLVLLLAATSAAPFESGESPEHEPEGPSWRLLATGTEASLRGLSALDRSTAWVTGSDGTALRTEDGGVTWVAVPIPGAQGLELRDVELFADGSVVVMTAGQPARIYRLDPGTGGWSTAHESPHGGAFFDALAFWDDGRGLAFSDPVDGRFLVLRTVDGGRSWQELSDLPLPLAGEAGFAASGSNVTVAPGGLAWIGTGGAAARVLRSVDHGASWQVAETPLAPHAPTAGIFSIDFRDARHGVAAGGDYERPEIRDRTLAWTADGGETWEAAAVPPPSGHRAAVRHLPRRYAPGSPGPVWISVGRGGSDLSTDDGRTWERFSDEGFYTLSVARDGSVWAAGAEGRVARLEWPPPARERDSL